MQHPSKKFDLCVIGGGAAGLSFAAFAAQMGTSLIIIEEDKMGGESLNAGCVPAKALLAVARAIKNTKAHQKWGMQCGTPTVDFLTAKTYMQSVIETISVRDSVERFEGFGATVIKGTAQFIDKKTIQIDNHQTIQARHFVIATGSLPSIPPIDGLNNVPYLTNRNLFELDHLPKHLVIIGGGPIGCEIAQIYRWLGSTVTILQRGHILSKDEPEAVEIIKQSLLDDGIQIYEHTKIESVSLNNSTKDKPITVTLTQNEQPMTITGSDLLIAAGRKPNFSELNLEAAGVQYTLRGISVNRKLQTSNKRISAIGDIIDGPKFTHIANYHASIVIKNRLFRWPAKINSILPWAIYTEPELAHVGLSEEQARKKYKEIQVLTQTFEENDRTIIEYYPQGLIKLVASKRGKILGVTIVCPQAGELITTWGLAIDNHLKLHRLANLIIPYPTLSEIHKQIAGKYYMSTLSAPWIKRMVHMFVRWF
jgi:pyruvate/2-oxoglutarate dehydrogenase complex dihydrolipoamide dehydrogenase (E3) component